MVRFEKALMLSKALDNKVGDSNRQNKLCSHRKADAFSLLAASCFVTRAAGMCA
jgi:hypothetical protein